MQECEIEVAELEYCSAVLVSHAGTSNFSKVFETLFWLPWILAITAGRLDGFSVS